MKIIYNKKQCIGCQSCTATCPKYFKTSKDGKVDIIKIEVKPDKELKEAVSSCPVMAIKIQ